MCRMPPCFSAGLLLFALAPASVAQQPVVPESTVQPAAGVPAAIVPDLGQPFATKSARFEPRSFDSLPGWEQDDLGEAAEGMRQSCAALHRKPVWAQLCGKFERIESGGNAGLRNFFEQNFHVYQVMSPAQDVTGKLTGYFEPLLDGSRVRDARFRYPVYGVPHDLYLLDSRRIDGNTAWLRLDGNRLKTASPGSAGAREYELALDDVGAGVRDKRYRVRIEGRRIVPYWSRQQIERRAIEAPVLAWAEDAGALYSMQVQGSGKIRLREGGLIRLAYAQQNGHPFRPRVTRGDVDFALTAIKARGLIAGSSAGAASARPGAATKVSAPVNTEVARIIARLKGEGGAGAPAPAPVPMQVASAPRPSATGQGMDKPRPKGGQSDEVAAIIAALKGQGPPPPPPPRPVDDAAGPAPVLASTGGGNSAGVGTSAHAGVVTGNPDPSYVFFRSIGDGPQGPIGALGVPLSPERSLAVDPRTTPLGAPVFISSKQPAGSGPMQKLMFAQDTGGAIRGSVRADFFWGFGDSAGRLALATNEVMQMWLLLPAQQPISAVAAKGMRLRGGKAELPDCVIADEELCVE